MQIVTAAEGLVKHHTYRAVDQVLDEAQKYLYSTSGPHV